MAISEGLVKKRIQYIREKMDYKTAEQLVKSLPDSMVNKVSLKMEYFCNEEDFQKILDNFSKSSKAERYYILSMISMLAFDQRVGNHKVDNIVTSFVFRFNNKFYQIDENKYGKIVVKEINEPNHYYVMVEFEQKRGI